MQLYLAAQCLIKLKLESHTVHLEKYKIQVSHCSQVFLNVHVNKATALPQLIY